MKYYVWKMHSDNKWFLPIYSRFEKKNIQVGLLGCIYQLISTANPALLKWNWAGLAVLISWLIQNGPPEFEKTRLKALWFENSQWLKKMTGQKTFQKIPHLLTFAYIRLQTFSYICLQLLILLTIHSNSPTFTYGKSIRIKNLQEPPGAKLHQSKGK